MTTRPQATTRQQARADRGATMVEFALIAIALFTLIFGIIEGAFAVRARNTINNAVDEAARKGAVAGTDADADFLILRQLTGRGADGAANIEYVVVYKADNGSSAVPPGCIDGVAQADVCNVFRPENFDNPASDFGCDGGLGNQWCPKDRVSGGDLGFLGVYIRADYEPIIEQIFFDFDFEVNGISVQAIETSGEL